MADDEQAPKPETSLTPTAPTAATSSRPPVPAFQAQPMLPGGFALHLGNPNAETQLLQKVTPDHISQELANGQQRAMRQLDLQAQQLSEEHEEHIRDHERDQRDRLEQAVTDRRLERIFYVVFISVAVLAVVLVLKDKADLAIKLGLGFIGFFVTLLGGVGVERLRQDRRRRRRRLEKPKADDEE